MVVQESSKDYTTPPQSQQNFQAVGTGEGIEIQQVFSCPEVHPFDQIEWCKRTARITDGDGKVIFQQDDVETPADWSQLATNVVVSKYFYGEVGKPQRETSVRQLVERVARTIADWGKQDGIFATDQDGERFYRELAYLCVNQHGSFNSPVWFNVGLYDQYGITGSQGNYHWDTEKRQAVKTEYGYRYPQASACFIQSVDDTMEDIMRLATAEAMLFKYGSGTGTDLSTLRSSREKLSGGGQPSGPLSFMRIYDQIAAVVRSGGKTRRAAKMQSLRCDHPDIKEFIECKMTEESKARALVKLGYDGSLNGDAYESVMYQNANLSVRVTDEFMQAAEEGRPWQTYAVTSGEPLDQYNARELLEAISEGTRVCGDPGVQYHTTINRWNTCPKSGEICASNPCSEYMFLNDSACNLASINLMKFRRPDGSFDVERFRAAVRIFIIAQEILVDHASYPSRRICKNSHDFRPLGLGYANLGALLMSLGLPYDSEAGRGVAAAITAIMTARAYQTSAELARRVGVFEEFDRNRDEMMNVIGMHRSAVDDIPAESCPGELLSAAIDGWDRALQAGRQAGYRNAQVSVLAPTGTIGFMMDCDTTGIEPDIALVKYKQLAGGGMFKMVNRTVPLALERLGYNPKQIEDIVANIEKHDTIEGAPHLQIEHLPVFDCAFKPVTGTRSINHMGHICMMGAVQPFLSGAISKTVNMSKESTTEQIMNVYIEGWKLGLKAVAIYRDGSKSAQPLSVSRSEEKSSQMISKEQLEAARREPHRHRLPATRPSITHKFEVAGHEGYLNVGLYEDGQPGELFITMAKEGSTVGGMMDAFATSISLCLQYGVPLEALVKKFAHQRFEPSGMTSSSDIPFAKSIVDYVFRWLGLTFLEDYRNSNLTKRSSEMDTTLRMVTSLSTNPHGAVAGEVEGADVQGGKYLRGGNGGGNGGGNPKGVNGERVEAIQTQVRSLQSPGSPPAAVKDPTLKRIDRRFSQYQEDAPACDVCGAITVRNGNCYKCYNCGSSLGCS